MNIPQFYFILFDFDYGEMVTPFVFFPFRDIPESENILAMKNSSEDRTYHFSYNYPVFVIYTKR